MTTPATLQKRRELLNFIELELAPEPAVQAVVGIGSIASGLARPDSDIDAIVFMDPMDPYLIPAEFVWRPSDRSFHGIFNDVAGAETCLQFDFLRVDFNRWLDPAFEWPEGYRSELSLGWMAYDRTGKVADLIAARTAYTEEIRINRLDEALVHLDQHLAGDKPQVRWNSLGFLIAHDRLQAAYDYLVQALFAYNRCWRPWRNREMSFLLALPWLPDDFANRLSGALSISTHDFAGYMSRVEVLRGLFQDLTARLIAAGLYGDDIISEAFIRSHNEPGRAWNMDAWNQKHAEKKELK